MQDIKNILKENNLDEGLAGKIALYLKLLLIANKKVNLTGSDNPHDIFDKYIQELFILVPFIKENSCRKILDLGSGAGYTGVTFSILFPGKTFFFMDSIKKKMDAVSDICRQMELENVSYIVQRAEEAAHKIALREQFDLVITRAVAPTNIVLELSAPFIKVGGLYAHYTTHTVKLEKNNSALKKLGLILQNTVSCEINTNKILQLMKKEKTTPQIYPRDYQIIKRSPLYEL